jgi:hypothetical protein
MLQALRLSLLATYESRVGAMSGITRQVVLGSVALCVMTGPLSPALAEVAASQSEKGSQKSTTPTSKATAEDPFANVVPAAPAQSATKEPERSGLKTFFIENFGFRKEIMSQFNINPEDRAASRQSAGFEVLKKFSTETSTIASFNFQGRIVRRDGYVPVLNDMEGKDRKGWAFEYHNFYLDFFNFLNPVLSDEGRGKNLGRFNIRAGHFYVPFGLNLQTDTHGAVLQLSNDRNFGFERDWYTGFWGTLNRHLNYEVYYLAGSGYDLKYKGQSGLGALRVSLGNKYSSEYGFEGGLSFLAGERLPSHIGMSDELDGAPDEPIETLRTGIDSRYRYAMPKGLLTLTTELSGGRDIPSSVFTQLHQAEYLHQSRRWGAAMQYRRFWEEGRGSDASIIGELTWYFRNDVGNSNLHWLKLNVERQLERIHGRPDTVITLQYYFYR